MVDWQDYIDDAMYDEYENQREAEEAYGKMREEILATFTSDLLKTYYIAHPKIPQVPYAMLDESRNLLVLSPAAATVFAYISVELTAKNLILRPLVHGVIHVESVADLVTNLTLSHSSMDRFRELLFGVLDEIAGINLKNYVRPGCARTFWEEIQGLQKRRNSIIHRGELVLPAEASEAIAIAEHVLSHVFHQAIRNLGFSLDHSKKLQQ